MLFSKLKILGNMCLIVVVWLVHTTDIGGFTRIGLRSKNKFKTGDFTKQRHYYLSTQQ